MKNKKNKNQIGCFHISYPRKMGRDVCSWGLQAGVTCPAKCDPATGKLWPVCSGCYALEGNYYGPDTKRVRAYNMQAWQLPDFVADAVLAIDGRFKYVRWFDSGDICSPELGYKILAIAQRTPNARHWIASKALALDAPQWQELRSRLEAQPNIALRVCYGHLDGKPKPQHTAIVLPHGVTPAVKAHVCPAERQGGECGACKACWNAAGVRVVAYRPHGTRIKSVLKQGG